MYISELSNIRTATLNVLEKKNITTARHMLMDTPRVYHDYLKFFTPKEAWKAERRCAIKGILVRHKKKFSNNRTILTARIECENADGSITPVSITWIGQAYMEHFLETAQGFEVVSCGIVKYDFQYGYTMSNPEDFVFYYNFAPHIEPVYPKYKGLSDEMRKSIVDRLIDFHSAEILPKELVEKRGLVSYKDMLKGLHRPWDREDCLRAKKRQIYEDLLYFSYKLKESDRMGDGITNFAMHRNSMQQKVIDSLPYELSDSQKEAVAEMLKDINMGKKLNVLLNGDVGAGKSIVIFLMMLACAENGYQAVLMAPTVILAEQHYKELCRYAENTALDVVFLQSGMKAKEKREALEKIESGEAKLIVGTHSVISDKVNYKNVALVITDEEHRFGAGQRDLLQQKAGKDANIISVSATPIPATLASVLYQNKKVCYLHPPKTKGQIQTAVVKRAKPALDFALKQIKEGRQCYAVCPMIETDENSNLASVDSVYQMYSDYFANTGVRIGCVTGKTDKAQAQEIIEKYRAGEIDILIATTVIEVGVSVQNASVMIIHNAERFGLSQLHQLRGRIGRGSYKGYCILISEQKDNNSRLSVMETTHDGFKIAEADLAERGTGDMIGKEQSGFNKYVDLMIRFDGIFKVAKSDLDWCLKNGISLDDFLAEYAV